MIKKKPHRPLPPLLPYPTPSPTTQPKNPIFPKKKVSNNFKKCSNLFE